MVSIYHMEQHYGICRVAVAPLRTEPSDKAEICSQLLFGDHVEILQKTEKWWQICNAFDDYIGWMDFKQLAGISSEEYSTINNCNYLAPISIANTTIGPDGSSYYLPTGSNLPSLNNGEFYLAKEKFTALFNPQPVDQSKNKDKIIHDALFFQNAPYLWGGRTMFGIDCSGLVQLVFKLSGIQLKRDAWQQAEQGATVDFLTEVQPGDVAFFDNDAGRITHVGIMLNEKDIIHASGKVRIDPMDNQGIYNTELGRYTHKLRIIRRFL